MKHKALQIFNDIKKEGEQFSASNGWFNRFKHRFGLRFLKVSGEKLSSDFASIEPFKKQLKDKIVEKGLKISQIYNADETGLYWKILPEHTFVPKEEQTAPGRKLCKNRLTAI